MKRTLLALYVMLGLNVPLVARATDSPVFSADRLSIAVGAQYARYSGDPVNPSWIGHEFEVGPALGYSLTDHFKAVGGVNYGLDSHRTRVTAGFRWVLKKEK